MERDRLVDEEVGELDLEVIERPWYQSLSVDPSRTASDVDGLGLQPAAGFAQLRYTLGPAEPDITDRHGAVCRVDARMLSESRPGTTLDAVLDAAVEQ